MSNKQKDHAEPLREMMEEHERAYVLLHATLNLLNKLEDGVPFDEATIFYDEAECDGGCLAIDIRDCLERHSEEQNPFQVTGVYDDYGQATSRAKDAMELIKELVRPVHCKNFKER